jgi:hypothetical protein
VTCLKTISCVNLTDYVVADCAVLVACSLLGNAQVLCFVEAVMVRHPSCKVKTKSELPLISTACLD